MLLSVAAFAACSGRPAQNANTQTDAVTAESTVAPMRIVTDDLGREVRLPQKIERAVSLAPNITEMVFAVGAGDRLVGVTTYCNYPAEAQSIQKVGDTLNPNIETIIALKPDVVLVSTASQLESFTKTLERNGINVFVTNPTSLKGVAQSVGEIGDVFDKRANADALQFKFNGVKQGIREATRFLSTPKVFVQISREPLFTIGQDSFLTEVVATAGGASVTSNVKTAFPKISKETALALQPEAIILSDSPDNQEPNEVFKNSPAVKNARVYKINADIISRPGPRLIDALKQIARDLHPEKFPE